MNYLSYTPPPPLDELIENFWCLSDAPAHRREEIVPSGTLELVLNLREDAFHIYGGTSGAATRYGGAIVSGAYPRPFVVDTRAHASIVGVHFRPGGALPLIGAPPGVVGATHVALEALWGTSASELRERLASASTPARRFQILTEVLLERLRRAPERHRMVAPAVAAMERPDVRVSEVCERAGLSHRRFIALFTREVGMPPKLFARVRRFQRAFQAAQRIAVPNWSALALSYGYFDQPHLIHEFAEFAGLPPEQMRRRRSHEVKVNHLVIPEPRGSISSNTA